MNNEYIDSEINKVYEELDDIYAELDTLKELKITNENENENLEQYSEKNSENLKLLENTFKNNIILVDSELKDLNNDIDVLNENIEVLNENVETLHKTVITNDNKTRKIIEKLEENIIIIEKEIEKKEEPDKKERKELKNEIKRDIEKIGEKMKKDIESINESINKSIENINENFNKKIESIETIEGKFNKKIEKIENIEVIDKINYDINKINKHTEIINGQLNLLHENIETIEKKFNEPFEIKLGDIKSSHISSDAITTSKISNNSITNDKLLMPYIKVESKDGIKIDTKSELEGIRGIAGSVVNLGENIKLSVDSSVLRTFGNQNIDGTLSMNILNTQTISRPNHLFKANLWNDGTGDINIGTNSTGNISIGQGPMLKLSTSSSVIKSDLIVHNNFSKKLTNSVINKNENTTYTAKQLFDGLITRYCNKIDKTDTIDMTPSASEIVSNFRDAILGSSFDVLIVNLSSNNEKLSIIPGIGVNIHNNLEILAGNAINIIVYLTNITPGKETVSIYSTNNSVPPTPVLPIPIPPLPTPVPTPVINFEENNKILEEKVDKKIEENNNILKEKIEENNTLFEEKVETISRKVETIENASKIIDNSNFIIKDAVIFKMSNNSSVINYASWCGFYCPINFSIDSTIIGISGTIVKMTCTYNSHSSIKINNVSNMLFSIGKLTVDNIFSVYKGGQNIIIWDNKNNNSYPSSSSNDLNIHIKEYDKIAIRLLENGKVIPNDMKINIQLVIKI